MQKRYILGIELGPGFFKRMVMGFVVGLAAVTPGLSGGVIAAAAGIYEPAIHALVNIHKEFRRSFAFLLPLALGAGPGLLLFSGVMQQLMAGAKFSVLYVFLGLVAGSLPALFREANRGGFRGRYMGVLAIALAVILLLGQAPAGAPNLSGQAELGFVNTMIYGGILAVGTIIPGISSSFILMYVGAYEGLLAAITGFEIRILFYLGLGFALTGLLILKQVAFIFRRFHGPAYYAVIGFLFGSMAMVFPGFREGWSLALDFTLFVVSAILSYMVMKLNLVQN